MKRILALCLTLSAIPCSCAKLGGRAADAKPAEASPFGPTGIPPELRSKTSDPGTAVVPGGNVKPKAFTLDATPDEDIVFTDPDNPSADIPELANILAAPKRGPWEASEAVAKKRSMREGKPLLIWFTNSQNSPMCKALTQELFSTSNFGSWAEENLVRLRVDANVTAEDTETLDQKTTLLIDRARYVGELKKRYKILGYPALIVLNSSGEVVGRYNGYKRGDAAFTFGQIKYAQSVAAHSYKSWRESLEKKGYREWRDKRGRKIFAKLVSYSKGTLVLVEPDGSRAQTQESKLSDEDIAWINQQKKIRNLR